MPKSENFGNVVIEALSQGTPVVASHGTPWSGLVDNQAGYWIENTPEEIARSIDFVLSMNDEDYSALRIKAHIYAQSFDVYENVNSWIKVLGEVSVCC